MKLLLAGVAAGALLCCTTQARADPSYAIVTTSCGTVPLGPYNYGTLGSAVPLVVDKTGALCLGSGGGGVGSNVNITGLNGTAPSTTNPLYVAPGSGQTFPVSASALPLPTGAATAANQEVTTAGSSATSAQAVQGVTGGIALPISGAISGSGIFQVSPTTAANTAANPFFNNLSIGGAVVSATNGEYANLLQGNAVISATNGIYSNLLQGNAVLSAANPLFTEVGDGVNTVSVKAASTAAAATDNSLVVQLNPIQPNLTTPLNVVMVPAATASFGITPIVSTSLESNHVLKGSAGNLYSLYVTTGVTGGFLMIFNATSAPADGAVTPVECIVAPANSTTSSSVSGSPPDVYSTGITAVFSSTGCFTKTASSTAFFKGRVQ